MKKIISAVALATVATGAWAQVPDLSDALGDLSSAELQDFNAGLDTAEPVLDADLDVTLDIATVNEAVSQGLISEADAADLGSALAIIEENAGYFNFDFEAFIADSLEGGFVSAADVAEVMEVFAGLSPEAKTIIGSEEFSPFVSVTCSSTVALSSCTANPNMTLANALTTDEQNAFLATQAVQKSNPLVPVGDITAAEILTELQNANCFTTNAGSECNL